MKLRITTGILIAALALCANAAFAQDQKQDTSPIDPNAPLQPLDMPTKPANPGEISRSPRNGRKDRQRAAKAESLSARCRGRLKDGRLKAG